MICSFDIFDTTLLRKCGKPENVFWLLATRLFPGNASLHLKFVSWRMTASYYLSYNTNHTLADIYKQWEPELWDNISMADVIQCEKDVEYEMLIANVEVLKIINDQRASGNQIVFISDMYLDSGFLETVLRREKAFKDGDAIYVSNECGSRKDTGDLFDYVRNIYQPQKWEHFGDNAISDVSIPQAKGIKSHHIITSYHPSELSLVGQSIQHSPTWELATLASISRSARLNLGNTPEVVLSADFVAPFLIPYVYHVIGDAKQKRIKTLYFVARDSYILMKLAELLPHDEIHFKFLFVSRKSLLPTFLLGIDRELFLLLFQSHTLVGERVHDIMSVIGMEHSATFQDFDIIHSKKQEDLILDYIFEDNFYERWQMQLKSKESIACQYLLQEGILDNNIALVDVGWYGSTRMMINSVRHKYRKDNCYSYYWGIQRIALGSEFGEYDSYMDYLTNDFWTTCLIEEYFLSCPYASTMGYERQTDKIVPVFKGGNNGENQNIYETNYRVAEYMLQLMRGIPFSDNGLRTWTKATLTYINSSDCQIDYSPMFQMFRHDTDTFAVKAFTIKDVLKYIRGRKITINDKVCLDYTFGNRRSKMIQRSRCFYLSLRNLVK